MVNKSSVITATGKVVREVYKLEKDKDILPTSHKGYPIF